MENVSKINVKENLRESIIQSVIHLGGFEKLFKKGDTVLLKPNFNTSDPYPASTEISFLKEVVKLIYEAGAKLVIIGESSTIYRNTRKEMEKLKIFELEKMEKPPKIHIFEENEWVKRKIPDGKYLKKVSVPKILEEVDKLVLLPCLKTHQIAQFTGSLKLSIGFMKPCERIPLHMKYVQEKTAELNKIIKPHLIIMDARKCFITKGPTHGEVREPNLILASKSRVNIDLEGINIIKSYNGNSLENIENITQIELAKKYGI